MINVKLDGKKEAERLAGFLEESERVLGKSLVIFQCDGRIEMSQYVRLKTEMGERLGVMVHVIFAENVEDLKSMLTEANEDETVDGILVQLPIFDLNDSVDTNPGFRIKSGMTNSSGVNLMYLPGLPSTSPTTWRGNDTEEILEMIKPSKDVDGLNRKSKFVPAAVKAVERIIDIFRVEEDQKIALIGAKGMVGKRMGERLNVLGLPFEGFDKGDDLGKLKEFDVIISAVGRDGLITEEMVQSGFVGIDLGYPKGDFSPEAVEKASLITPVPGGVGPLTVVELYENLAEA